MTIYSFKVGDLLIMRGTKYGFQEVFIGDLYTKTDDTVRSLKCLNTGHTWPNCDSTRWFDLEKIEGVKVKHCKK